MGFDMSITGFQPGEITALLRPSPNALSEPPTPQSKGPPTARAGDLWLLGDHRLICADSTKADTWAALMDGRQASMVFTDPPYGVSYQDGKGNFKEIQGDALRRGQLRDMLHSAFAAALPHTARDAAWYVWHASITREDFAAAMRDVGLVESANGYLIWAKPQVMGWTDYASAHEPCFYAHQQGVDPHFHGERGQANILRIAARTKGNDPATVIGQGVVVALPSGQELYIAPAPPKGRKVRHIALEPGQPLALSLAEGTDVWEVSREKEESIHPTQKPVELARRAIRNSSREGEIVVDFFLGSGSTLIAAEQLGRACYAIDLEPAYIDATIRRWQESTGKTATHAKEQKTFEAVSKARAGKKAAAR